MPDSSTRNKRPANLAPLNLSAFKDDAVPLTPRSSGHSSTHPSRLTLVVGGSASIEAVDALAHKLKESSKFGNAEGVQLRGIIYEGNVGEGTDVVSKASVSLGATNQTPISLVTPLTATSSKAVPTLPDANDQPRHLTTSFALPAFASAAALSDNAAAWAELLSEASKRHYTLDLALSHSASKGGKEAEKLREAVEELLGKAWDADVQRAKAEGWSEEINTKGARFVLDAFGGPPLTDDSESLADWNGFIRRLALHPRVFLKLSPLSLASLVPGVPAAPGRSVDVALPVGSSVAHAALEGASAAAGAVANAASSALPKSSSPTLRERTRALLDAAVEAFGEERLVWASHLTAATAATDAKKDNEDQALSEPEEWFEVVREGLADMGLTQESLDNIFANNASKLYKF